MPRDDTMLRRSCQLTELAQSGDQTPFCLRQHGTLFFYVCAFRAPREKRKPKDGKHRSAEG
jgi:hypothetical protein